MTQTDVDTYMVCVESLLSKSACAEFVVALVRSSCMQDSEDEDGIGGICN